MKKIWIAKSLAFTAISALLLSGCATNSSSSDGKLDVVTTFYPMYEFTKQVAGDHANVIALIPAGAEPHDFEPSAKDMKKVKNANVFVYNGIVEGWAEQALKSAENKNRVVVEASKGIDLMEGLPEEDEHEDDKKQEKDKIDPKEADGGKILDPHVWLDPVLAQKEVEAIVTGLTQADPAHKDDYRKNADAFIVKLKAFEQVLKMSNAKNSSPSMLLLAIWPKNMG